MLQHLAALLLKSPGSKHWEFGTAHSFGWHAGGFTAPLPAEHMHVNTDHFELALSVWKGGAFDVYCSCTVGGATVKNTPPLSLWIWEFFSTFRRGWSQKDPSCRAKPIVTTYAPSNQILDKSKQESRESQGKRLEEEEWEWVRGHTDSLQRIQTTDYGNLPFFVPREMFSSYAFYLCKKGCEPLQFVTVGTFCVVSG